MEKIKYSIIMPYYNRLEQFKKTLSSFSFWYAKRKDVEVILILDNKVPQKEKEEILTLVEKTSDINIQVICKEIDGFNPCVSFNMGANIANGEFFVLTNPECYHVTDVLCGLDVEFDIDSGVYVVCACKALKKDNTMRIWYQHSVFRNKRYHFCSALHKETYWSVGGFDERFNDGISYDDDAFRDSLEREGIQFICKDDLVVYHLFHEKEKPDGYKVKLRQNKKVYETYYNI